MGLVSKRFNEHYITQGTCNASRSILILSCTEENYKSLRKQKNYKVPKMDTMIMQMIHNV